MSSTASSGLRGVEVRANSIRISWTGPDGHDRATLKHNGQPLPPTAANIKHAARVAAQIRAAVASGAFNRADFFPDDAATGQPSTLASALTAWLGTLRIEASTRKGYASAARFWCAALGTRPLRSIKPGDIRAAMVSRPISAKTVNNYLSVLSKALDAAVADGSIPESPAAGIQCLKHQRPGPDPLTPDEVDAILADMRQHYPPEVADYTEFRVYTGARPSELAALSWSDVALTAPAHMLIDRAIVEGVAKDNTKTNVARRVLLNSRALAALQRQAGRTGRSTAAVWIDPRRGERWEKAAYFQRWYWGPTFKRLGLRYREPYQTRHTYATMMLMAGMTPAFCARQLGHSVEVFLRTYSRWLDGSADASEMARLEAAMQR